MNHRKMNTVAGIVSIAAACLLSFPTRGLVLMSNAQQGQQVLLPRLLEELGREHDRFFTIEAAWKDGEAMNAIESQWLQRSSKRTKLQDELEHLRQNIRNFTYEIDKANPRFVHIMDARLAAQKGYGLERIVDSIDFVGTGGGLVEALIKQGIPLSPITLMSIHEFSFNDSIQVRIQHGERLEVRDVLTRSIPLERHTNRILWVARTRLGQGELSYIYFQGTGTGQ
jgi:hypothetical protein